MPNGLCGFGGICTGCSREGMYISGAGSGCMTVYFGGRPRRFSLLVGTGFAEGSEGGDVRR